MPPATNACPIHGIIPARYASTRFPGKPLADILGKPMFWHVWHRASQCTQIRSVTLATDDERIFTAAERQGVPVVMTGTDLPSGTDRVFQAAVKMRLPEDSIIINIQGDEPALDPKALADLTAPFSDPLVQSATLVHAISPQEAASPDRVKVVLNARNDTLYFSRAAVPFDRDGTGVTYWGHIGIYAFRLPVLRRFTLLPPSPLEQIEKLEQLRLLENNIPLRAVKTSQGSRGVDRPEDLPGVIQALR
ncbi:MAG: 3-deoxy-manno-octulosonate cytidylyltransferase [Deltaproteobacteria bacterium]|jgi:3-deoxy-manno-octulosonate cytidylyltransferase (CMP-KDO synthetase)|nr:3-deoxy-manno-octulosonate cytidylyltransferase [Deltaproteobacteria bacterium]